MTAYVGEDVAYGEHSCIASDIQTCTVTKEISVVVLQEAGN